MRPDDLLERLETYRIKASRSTLARWVKQGVVSEPKRGSLGRGRGRFSEYAPEAVGEAAAAGWLFYQGATVDEVRRVREIALTAHDFSEVLGMEVKDAETFRELMRGHIKPPPGKKGWVFLFGLLFWRGSYPEGLEWLDDAAVRGQDGSSRLAKLLEQWIATYTMVNERWPLDVVIVASWQRGEDGLWRLTARRVS